MTGKDKAALFEHPLPFLTTETKQLLSNTLIMPYLDYCCESWSSATEGRLERLEQWYRRAIELGNPEGTAEVSLKNRIHRNISIMTFECVNNLAPPYLQDRFSLVKDIHEKKIWKHYPSNSEPTPSGTVYCQLSLVSKVSCSSSPKLRNWYNVNIEYWLLTQTHNFSDLKS